MRRRRGGHAPGQARTYEVQVTRTSGPDGARVHRLSWLGDDGTFTAPQTVTLPLDTPVTVRIAARPAVGAHGAVLRVDDPTTPGLDARALAVVVAGEELGRPSYAWSTGGDVERNGTQTFFVTVPEGAEALQVNLSGIATGSQTRFIAFDPYGRPVESTSSLACYTNFSDVKACNPVSRSYSRPLPGVIEVESRRTSPFLTNPFRLTAAAQGVRVEPETVVLERARAGVATPVSWTVTNAFGPVTVVPTGGPLGSARTERPTIADGATASYTVEVPAGASSLEVAIGNPADPAADLDLTVLLGGVPVGSSADGDSEELVVLPRPAPGTYTVQIDGYSVPSGSTAYDYRDVFYAGSLGSVAVPATPRSLPAGATATVASTVTATAAPAAGRELFGEMRLRTTEGAVVGRGGVLVRRVNTS